MSAITFGRVSNDALVFGGSPQVHLLPGEIDEQRKSKAFRRTLLMGLAGAVVIVIGAVAFVSIGLIAANAAQATEQARAAQIATEVAKYGEVTSVQGQVDAIKQIQPIVTSGEVLWSPFLASVSAKLTSDMYVTSFNARVDSPVASSAAVSAVVNPLDVEHVATVTVTGSGPQNSVQAWLAQLPSLKGVVSSSPTLVIFNQDTGLYDGTVDLYLGKDAIASRFGKAAK